MKTYNFRLRFALSDPDEDPATYVEPLYKVADDALFGIAEKGKIAFLFSREASSSHDAIFSAVNDVLNVIPSATLIEIFYNDEEI